VIDELEVLLQFSQLGGHVGAVGFHEGKAFLLVAAPGGHELGVASDGLDGHAGGPQPGADSDPVQVSLPIASPAAIGAVDGGDDQASALVVAQGVDAHPGAGSGLRDAQARLLVGASRPGYGPRLDFEHTLDPSIAAMSPSMPPRTQRASVDGPPFVERG
jgi:hypothetical protein